MVELYCHAGLEIYEQAHYRQGEAGEEVDRMLTWYDRAGSRILDLGCSGGLHALELARRGHRVVGVDVETSAIELAGRRAQAEGLGAEFRVLDLNRDPLAPLGAFDLIYSIGNVLSHLPRERLPTVLEQIRGCCAPDALILFDLLVIGPFFPAEVYEEAQEILWQRRRDLASGKIELQGIFSRFGVVANFQLWGYSGAEVMDLLQSSGFREIACSAALDFPAAGSDTEKAVSLKFRARPARRKR